MEKDNLNQYSTNFMIANLQEAHNYLRDTSKRMADQIQFYLTLTTALLAGLFVMINDPNNLAQLPLSIAILCAVEAGVGYITFTRLISIKSQATNHFARAYRWSQFFLDNDKHLQNYFVGEEMLRESELRARHFPFTRPIIILLSTFAIFNSWILGISVFFGINAVFVFSGSAVWLPNSYYFTSYGLPSTFILISATIVSISYLRTEVKNARADFAHILGDEKRIKQIKGKEKPSSQSKK